MAISLSDLARQLRYHDWSACMSDSYAVTRSAREHMSKLGGYAGESKNHARLFELGCAHERRFTWSVNEGEPCPPSASREEVHEAAWRWAGAYCWALGVRLSEDEAKALVGGVDDHHDWYGRQVSSARTIDWKRIDELVKGVSA